MVCFTSNPKNCQLEDEKNEHEKQDLEKADLQNRKNVQQNANAMKKMQGSTELEKNLKYVTKVNIEKHKQESLNFNIIKTNLEKLNYSMKNLVKNNSKTNSSAASGIEEKLWYSLWLEKVKTKPHSTLKKMTKQWNNVIKQVDESNIKENCLD